MQHSVLHKILLYKKQWISKKKQYYPLHILQNTIKKSKRNFYKALSNQTHQTILILECKKASPSNGIICNNFNPIEIAKIYKNYATIISVLTDKKYFHGNFNILKNISNHVEQPILCKDFFISEWQIYFARFYQADAILLILSILDDATYQQLVYIAHKLCMGVLTEISNENELHRAKYLGAKVIGINNRNLHNLSIDLNRTIILGKKIPKHITSISESGIECYAHIKKLKHYVNGFLIGTKLMSQPKLDIAIKKLIFGENKICGLTKTQDAKFIDKLGAIYGGLIFVPNSMRYISIKSAENIVSGTKRLCYVGVFANENISHIINIVNILHLSAIQLHGAEDQNYINILRNQLPSTCHIWKYIDMNHTVLIKQHKLINVHRYLADNGGGSGKTFNWTLLSTMKRRKTILAGGLTIDNCAKAAQMGCAGLDFNSGVEILPGIKDHQKLTKIFRILHV
ncbi:bifunctional indole-3-glycerol-phosphate synthase TrpC/phosphoribosylanthranilate isomerase TrpF [Candidatus Blochmannia ocreatus (nom. nud.)]|uniref:Multifunctional fusion protein n=1 Tax=Candidatus Blochmannia ocreatus (nom. nud.) TaxID=251538 RepID=A0ABY4SY64_9ENTR|nr:bifunctional indole-3-glycerol-phosphate synthase TrpC/phosphoribosylanthranilate isomerase TrpF [Candidatus Blochmannia ocreatus]URJ24927.1 bifunctional indole-3-glycerol-phosphate synthase TrpC/phosphoribosylanthranilate isomerase TrpF [Candidatus Blochmannia ocreatus]